MTRLDLGRSAPRRSDLRRPDSRHPDLPRAEPGHGHAPDTTTDRFRPDLEGLRAVAVLLVLLFHAGVPGFGGGYIGVDVFFVLSGFLITGLVARELERTGTVSLAAFYARRARRLLPAAALVIVVTVAAAAIFLPPLRVPDIAADGTAAALYVSNLRFAFQATDYLQSELAPSPLLHYWSLGVEEQFYLLWPALLLLTVRWSGRRSGGQAARLPGVQAGSRSSAGTLSVARLAAVITGVGIASLALSIVLTGVAEPWAFYSLPARAWELALGGLLALAAFRSLELPAALATALTAIGVVLIVIAGMIFDTTTAFPGTAALLPTAGAALVIAGGFTRSLGVAGRVLSTAPLRWLGRISYSLYLWHWPILVIPAAALETTLPLPVRILLALVAIPIAALSQRFVEEPIRRGRFVGLRPGRSLAIAGVATVLVASLTIGIGNAALSSPAFASTGGGPGASLPADLGTILGSSAPTTGSASSGSASSGSTPTAPTPGAAPSATAANGPTDSPPATPTRPPTAAGRVPANLRPSLAAARGSLPVTYADGCHLDFAATRPGPCAFGLTTSTKTMILFGDSHAAQWFPALERLAIQDGWRLVSLTKSACPTADVNVWNSALGRTYTECGTWRTNVLARIAAERPRLIVASDSLYTLAIAGSPVPVADRMPLWNAALARTLGRLAKLAPHVLLIGDTPRSGVDPPVCLSAHLTDALACATLTATALDPVYLAAEGAAAASAGVSFLDPGRLVCPSEPCPAIVGNVLIYRDYQHLTAVFSTAVAPYLGARLPGFGP
ncbi:MAG: acyltransferase [Chloroflexi bacterium]|nr:acyltransferase [Chloroflexota bacterium]